MGNHHRVCAIPKKFVANLAGQKRAAHIHRLKHHPHRRKPQDHRHRSPRRKSSQRALGAIDALTVGGGVVIAALLYGAVDQLLGQVAPRAALLRGRT